MPTTWPPLLAELKNDMDIPVDETEDDQALTNRLEASVRFVQRVRPEAFQHDEFGEFVIPLVLVEREAETIFQGTLMLAARLFSRRKSQDAVLFMAETGTTKIPFADDDLNRLLRLGRHALPKVG